MQRRLPTTVALVVLLVLAGCTGGTSGTGGGSGPATTATPTPPSTPTATPASSGSSGGSGASKTTQPSGEITEVPTEKYVAPITPNRPTETVSDSPNRIINAKFTNKVESKHGDGYADFDVLMLANTSMENVDPPAHGDVEGEPYTLVIINGKLVERSDYLEMKDEGRFIVDINPRGFKHHDIEPGTLHVKVMLMDQDSAHDDVYGTWTGTIEWSR